MELARSISLKLVLKEVKLSLFEDNIILYIENPKHSIKKIVKLISEFSKVTGYKSIHKNLAFFYNNNELQKLLRITPLTIASKIIN